MLEILARLTAILSGLCVLGGSFLVWPRSRAAALLGALAGAAIVFFEIVYVVLGKMAMSSPITPAQMSMMFATAGSFQALGTYVPLGIMVFLLARTR